MEIKGLLFDYGGTLDTNGQHWGAVLWEKYKASGILLPKDIFVQCFSHGERQLAIHPIIKKDFDFRQVLIAKLNIQFQFLKEHHDILIEENKISAIAEKCDAEVRMHIRKVVPMLETLKNKGYQMAVVSNFYGNLKTVLKEYGILDLFDAIIESAVVGVRKPDPAIYKLGYESLQLSPDQCLVIGDSFEKDIVPAHKNGCRSLWVNVSEWMDAAKPTTRLDAKVMDLETNNILKLPDILSGI